VGCCGDDYVEETPDVPTMVKEAQKKAAVANSLAQIQSKLTVNRESLDNQRAALDDKENALLAAKAAMEKTESELRAAEAAFENAERTFLSAHLEIDKYRSGFLSVQIENDTLRNEADKTAKRLKIIENYEGILSGKEHPSIASEDKG
jgi:chromosome segregation ATPase